MSKPAKAHLAESTLLRYVGAELDDREGGRVRRHVRGCPPCGVNLAQIRRLDRALQSLAGELLYGDGSAGSLAAGDAFAKRRSAPRFGLPVPGWDLAGAAVDASGPARERMAALIEATRAGEDRRDGALDGLDLESLEGRYTLAYTLDEARRFTEGAPARWLAFGRAARKRLEASVEGRAGAVLPRAELLALAHLLEGVALSRMQRYEKAAPRLRDAYRWLGRCRRPARLLGMVEMEEGRRRLSLGRFKEAAALTSRAASSFDVLALAPDAARARFFKGQALAGLGRWDAASAAFEGALEVFLEASLYRGAAATLGQLVTSLRKAGRADEAGRAARRALRRVPLREAPSGRAFVAVRVAQNEMAGRRWAAASKLLREAHEALDEKGLVAESFNARLMLIECEARLGLAEAARSARDALLKDVGRHHPLSRAIVRRLRHALSGRRPAATVIAAACGKASIPTFTDLYGRGEPDRAPADAILEAARVSMSRATDTIGALESDPSRAFALLYACQKSDALLGADPIRGTELGKIIFEEAMSLTDIHTDRKNASPARRLMVQAEAVLLQARGLLMLGHSKEGGDCIEPGRKLFEKSGDVGFGAALCDFYEGQAATFCRDLGTGERLLKRALKVFAEFGQDALISKAEVALGTLLISRGDFDRALECFDHALASVPDPSVMTMALVNRGTLLARFERFDEARATYARALTIGRKHGFTSRLQIIRNGLAELDFLRKNYGRALTAFQGLARDAAAAGFDVDYLFARLYVAECLARLGREEDLSREIDSLRIEMKATPFAPSPAMEELFACFDQGALDADLVAYVRRYLEDRENGVGRPYLRARLAG